MSFPPCLISTGINAAWPAPALPVLSLPWQEQAYGRLTGMKKAQRAKNNAFYSNRSFSRDVRKVSE